VNVSYLSGVPWQTRACLVLYAHIKR